MLLEGKNALITGAARGIGAAMRVMWPTLSHWSLSPYLRAGTSLSGTSSASENAFTYFSRFVM